MSAVRLVTCRDEFLAQMIELRHAAGISQLECDHQSGLQPGYTGKLEAGIRRAIHESFWWWLPVVSSGIVITPRDAPTSQTQCPCCGGATYLRF